MTAQGGRTLWGRRSSCNVQKALWVLEELALDYRRIDAGGDAGGLDDPAYLAMNPTGWVPTLRDGDVTVWDSEAIIRYLAARYGGVDGAVGLYPPARQAVVDQWIAWASAHLYPDWIRLFWKLVRTPEAARRHDEIAAHHAATVERLRFLDRQLAGRRFMAGGRFSLADVPVGMTLYRWFEMDVERPAMPAVEQYYARLLERPAYRTAICIPFDDLLGKTTY